MADIKDEVIQQLGLALGRDSGVPEGWAKIVAVVRIGPGTFGGWSKAYMADDTPVNFYTEDEDFPKYAQRLRDLMIDDDGNTWVACKVTLIRETRDINVLFEYENPKIWDTPLPF